MLHKWLMWSVFAGILLRMQATPAQEQPPLPSSSKEKHQASDLIVIAEFVGVESGLGIPAHVLTAPPDPSERYSALRCTLSVKAVLKGKLSQDELIFVCYREKTDKELGLPERVDVRGVVNGPSLIAVSSLIRRGNRKLLPPKECLCFLKKVGRVYVPVSGQTDASCSILKLDRTTESGLPRRIEDD